jgi:hypothetical protein
MHRIRPLGFFFHKIAPYYVLENVFQPHKPGVIISLFPPLAELAQDRSLGKMRGKKKQPSIADFAQPNYYFNQLSLLDLQRHARREPGQLPRLAGPWLRPRWPIFVSRICKTRI